MTTLKLARNERREKQIAEKIKEKLNLELEVRYSIFEVAIYLTKRQVVNFKTLEAINNLLLDELKDTAKDTYIIPDNNQVILTVRLDHEAFF